MPIAGHLTEEKELLRAGQIIIVIT